MMQEVNPKETTRAYAFEMWMKAPMPMVTLFKTLDVTRLRRISRRRGLKFNMLMCWSIGRAASQVKEFYMLPVGGKLMQYDSIAVNTIVLNREGEVSSCDIPYSDDLAVFNSDYLRLTNKVAEICENNDIADSMVIGTSALAQYDINFTTLRWTVHMRHAFSTNCRKQSISCNDIFIIVNTPLTSCVFFNYWNRIRFGMCSGFCPLPA